MKPEQEQIEDMAKDLEEAKYYALGTVGSLNNGFGGWYGKYMYNKGYRKASEVIDEFMKRLKAKESPKLLTWEYGEGYSDCIKIVEQIADEMRQEVEK